MSAVSNFIGSISPEMFGNSVKNTVQDVDLGDTTFSDMLEKQMNAIEQDKNNFANNLGIQNGVNIMDLTQNPSPVFETNTNGGDNNILDMVKPVKETDESVFHYMNDTKNMSTPEVVTFFNSLFDSKPSLTETETNGLFDFEKKVAANKYNKYAKNIVVDLNEFVTDAIKKKS